jgi:outer membrane protein assembly factor BamB
MDKRFIDIILIFGTFFLIIFSSIIPLVIGKNYMDLDEKQSNYDLYRYDEFHPSECSINIEKSINKDFSNIAFRPSVTSPMTLIDGPMDSPWSMQSHDTHHTGRSQYSTEDNPGTEKWRFHFTGWLEDTPVIDSDGTIYCKGAYNYLDRYLYTIYPNGTLKWRFKTNGLILGSSPAIDEDGTIYIGSWDEKLYAINPNGTKKWHFDSGGDIASSPAIAEDGTIYFGNFGKGIFAVNPNGTQKWFYDPGHDVLSDSAIGDDGTIYVGCWNGIFYAIFPNGTLRWSFPTGGIIKGPASIAEDGTIYFGSYDDNLYALNPDGTEKWRIPIGTGTETNPSIGIDGTIYVGDDKLYAVNPNGTLKWSFNLGANRRIHQSSPAISADGTIYVGANIGNGAGGEIVAVNPDGTERWRKRIADYWVESSPSIGEDGTVYIGSSYDMSKGYLHAFGEGDQNAPEAPTITGETQGYYGESYDYTFVSNDPENQDIRYYIDWGDDSYEEWIGPYSSGEEVVVSHTWDEEKTYTISAKAKDTLDVESPWSTLKVTMPVNQHSYSFPLLQRFLECFPNAFPILRQLLEL